MSERARVLVVDDEPANRKLLGDLVRFQGYQPLLASSGAEALALIEQQAVDVVLLDIMMPGMSGLEVLDRLASQGLTPALPVLMVSALTDRESRIAALERGATDFINKPIDRHELAARLRTVVQLKSLRDQLQSRLQDSETIHQALMDGAAVPILVLDSNLCVYAANQAALRLYQPENGPLPGQSYTALVMGEDRATVGQALTDVLESGVPLKDFPMRVGGPGGREVLLNGSASRVETAQGRLIITVNLDVTEERRTQLQLAEREEELRRAQQVARLGSIRLVDPASGRSSWSEEVFRLLGLPQDTPPGYEAFMARVHPDDRQFVARMRDHGLKSGWVEFEHRIVIGEEGWTEERWLRVRGEAQVDSQGSPALIATLQDITELKQAELAREESLRFGQEVLDSLTSVVAIVDERGVIVATNRAWRDNALARGGTLQSTAEGANYLAVCEATPEGQQIARTIRQALAGQPIPDEIEYECSSPSQESWFWCQVSRLNRQGPGRVAVTHHDITRLKWAEGSAAQRAQRLDLLTAHLPLVLWEGEKCGGIITTRWVSENVEGVLGVSADALIGNNQWLSYVHPDDRDNLLQARRLAPTRQWLEEYRWCRPDGSVIHLQAGVSAEGEHLVGFALDVSESKKLAAILLQAQKMDAVGQLTGGIAHDFNNLLGVIRCYTSFVHDELPEGDPQRDDLNEVLAASDRAIALTRQLLAFSRPQMSVRRPLDLNPHLADLLKMLRRCVGEAIEVQLTASARPAVVRLDHVHFDQLVMNLAVNARDAMPDGGRLSLGLSQLSEGGDCPSGPRVRLVVRDTGTGMDSTTLGRIFDPFFTTKEVGKGTGLGLATCYGLVKEAGGTISVESAPGSGTTFTIDFPYCDEPPEETLQDELADLQAVSQRRVLVIEDDRSLREAAVRILESAGYQVRQAQDGPDGIQQIDQFWHELDLIFTDVVMPGSGGYAVAEHARMRAPGLAVVLTSGHLDRQPTAPNPPNHLPLLWKPYTAASLLRTVAAALQDGPARDEVGDRPVPNLVTESRPLEEEPGPAPMPPTEPSNPDTTSAAPSAGHILLVEDDEAQQQAYTRALRSAGFAVTVAGSGEEAMEWVERLSFDALVTDIGLPGMGGIALLRAVRARDLEMPLLIITGMPSLDSATTAVHSQAVAYLTKPFPLEFLVKEVGQAVEAGQVKRLQRKLLAAQAGADEFLLDLPATRRSLDAALQQLHMVFQPIVRSQDGSIFGFEALLRSAEPTLCTPLKVIAAADVLGRTDEVGRAVRTAIATALAQHPERYEQIFVNLHPMELRSALLCAATEPLLRSASRVVLEVTERASLSPGPEFNEELRRLRGAGYRIAIDDLGEGFAGLSWLAQIRPDVAKIDMSLVRGAPQSPLKREILASLINLCRRSVITVVAEGLETEDEVRLLTDLGCELLQGYYFSRPGPAFPEVRRVAS